MLEFLKMPNGIWITNRMKIYDFLDSTELVASFVKWLLDECDSNSWKCMNVGTWFSRCPSMAEDSYEQQTTQGC